MYKLIIYFRQINMRYKYMIIWKLTFKIML